MSQPTTIKEIRGKAETALCCHNVPVATLQLEAVRLIQALERVTSPHAKALAFVGRTALEQAGDSKYALAELVFWLGGIKVGWV